MTSPFADIGKIGFALALGVALCGPALAEPVPSNGQQREATLMPKQLDFMRLKHIPPVKVMRLDRESKRRFDEPSFLDDPQETKQKINNFEQEVTQTLENLPLSKRQLTMLLFVEDMAGNANLAGFFWRPAANFAPQILKVLTELDFQPQARVFTEAMAAFGTDYPVDYRKRDKLSPTTKVMRELRNVDMSDERALAAFAPKPDELQQKLLTLSDQFWDKGGFDRTIGTLIAKTPELAAWVEDIRPTLLEKERLYWLADQLQISATSEVAIRQQVLSWPKPYRQLYVLSWFNGETLNGGMHQFFFNSSGLFAPEVVEALRDAGLPDMADAVQEGIDLFPKPYPVWTEERRNSLANFLDESSKKDDRDDKIGALTDKIYTAETTGDNENSPLLAAMIAYAKRENILPQ